MRIKANWLYQATVDAKTPIMVHSGGSSSSKTYSVLQALFTIAATKQSKIITVVGQDIPNLKKGAIRDAASIVASTPFFEGMIDGYNRSDHVYRFKTGSVIEFTSYDTEQDAKSGKRTHCFLNEANGIDYGVFEQLRIRTSELTVLDFNPSAEFWAHKHLQGRDDVTWINSTFRDNAFIHPSVKAAIMSYEPTAENIARGTANEYRWKVYGLGELGRLEGLVYPDFSTTSQWPDEDAVKWRVFGLDFGFTNDPTALVECVQAGGALWFREWIYQTGMTNADISDRMKQLGMEQKALIIADSAEPKSIEELRREGWNVRPAVKGRDSINHGISLVKQYPQKIHVKSRNLIDEFNSYTWAKDRNGASLNKPIDAYNHCQDALRYACSHQLTIRKKTLAWA